MVDSSKLLSNRSYFFEILPYYITLGLQITIKNEDCENTE